MKFAIALLVLLLSTPTYAGNHPQLPTEPPPASAPAVPTACAKRPCVIADSLTGNITETDVLAVKALLGIVAEVKADAVAFGIDSGGGDQEAAKEIFDLIKASGVPFYCYVGDSAMSGAFLVLQACTERVAVPGARLMIHEGYVHTTSDRTMRRMDIVRMLSDLDAMNEAMYTIIAPRMNMKAADLAARCAQGDWFMGTTSALAAHALDAVVTVGPEAYVEQVRARISKLKSK